MLSGIASGFTFCAYDITMPFSENLKKQVKDKSAYRCCLCEQFNASIQIHHIIPEKDDGPDTFENAAPLCATCHDSYGGNPDKKKFIKDKRDWWYSKVEKKYDNVAFDKSLLNKIVEKVISIEQKQENIEQNLLELKTFLIDYNNSFFSYYSKSPKSENIKNLNESIINEINPSSTSYISNVIVNSTTSLMADWGVTESEE